MLKKITLICFFSFFAIFACCGMEEERERYSLEDVAHLKQSIDTLEPRLNGMLATNQSGGIASFDELVTTVHTHINRLNEYCTQEAQARSNRGESYCACDELTALCNHLQEKVGDLNGKVQHTCSPDLNGIDKEFVIAEACATGYEIIDMLEMFFGLVGNKNEIVDIYSKVNVPPIILRKLIKKPLALDRALEVCCERWFGNDGLAQRYRDSLYPKIEEKAAFLHGVYQEADHLLEKLKLLDKTIRGIEFTIHELSRNKNKQQEDQLEALAQKSVNEAKRLRTHQELVHIYRSPLEMHSTDRAVYPIVLTHTRSGDSQERSQACLQTLLKLAVDVAIRYNFVDDLYGHLVIASHDKESLLADLACRLRIATHHEAYADTEHAQSCAALPEHNNDSAIDALCMRLAHGVHTAFVHGHKQASRLHEVPQNVASAGNVVGGLSGAFEKVSTAIGYKEWVGSGVGTITGALGRGARLLFRRNGSEDGKGKEKEVHEIDSESCGQEEKEAAAFSQKLRKQAFKMRKVEGRVDKAAHDLQSLVGGITGFIATNRQDFLRINALAMILAGYSQTDARSRNFGDRSNPFRQSLDQLSHVWDQPETFLHPASPVALPISSVQASS